MKLLLNWKSWRRNWDFKMIEFSIITKSGQELAAITIGSVDKVRFSPYCYTNGISGTDHMELLRKRNNPYFTAFYNECNEFHDNRFEQLFGFPINNFSIEVGTKKLRQFLIEKAAKLNLQVKQSINCYSSKPEIKIFN